MNILATYRHYPFTIARYIVEALTELGHKVVTAGPAYGTYIPWTDTETGVAGMELPARYIDEPDIPLPDEAEVSFDYIDSLLHSLQGFDLVLQLTPGWRVTGRPPNDTPHVLVMTDPHVVRFWYDAVKADFTHVVSMQMCYARPDEYVMPYGYSPAHHKPMDIETTKMGHQFHIRLMRDYDVVCIGLQYPNRTLVMDDLKYSGLNTLSKVGLVFDEYREVYNRAKIGFTWSSRKDTIARVFEIPRMGAAMVANVTPDMPLFFKNGVDYRGFSEAREAIASCRDLVRDQSLRLQLADNAFRTAEPHTYNQRVEFLLNSLGFGISAAEHNEAFLDWLRELP